MAKTRTMRVKWTVPTGPIWEARVPLHCDGCGLFLPEGIVQLGEIHTGCIRGGAFRLFAGDGD